MGFFSDTGDLEMMGQIAFSDRFPIRPSAAFTTQEMLLGMCQASTNENFLPPQRRESSVERGRMTDAVAYQGREWQLAPLQPAFKEGSPALLQARVLTHIPHIPNTEEVP